MIKGTELRVGNLIEFNHVGDNGKDNWVINPVTPEDIHSFIQDPVGMNECHRIIPVTTDVLIDFGFTRAPDTFYGGWISYPNKHGEQLRIRFNDKGLAYYTANSCAVSLILQGLHELQNLFFALNHQELTKPGDIPFRNTANSQFIKRES